jgi:hypothetical protein
MMLIKMNIYRSLHSSLEIVTTLYDRDLNRDFASNFLTYSIRSERSSIISTYLKIVQKFIIDRIIGVDLMVQAQAIIHPAAARESSHHQRDRVFLE